MRAKSVWFPAERSVEIREEEIGNRGPGEVTAEAIVSGISHGTEMSIYRGEAPSVPTVLRHPWDTFTPDPGGSFEERFPIKYAYSNVSRIIDAGPDTGFKPGDLVFARAPHQSIFNVPSFYCTPLPADLSPLEAATTLGLLDVSVNAMLDWPVLIGDVIVVTGVGLVGQFCVALASRMADAVVAVDPIRARRNQAMKMGATHTASPDDAAALVAELTDGRGADSLYECSGAPSALQTCFAAAGAEAAVVVPAYYGLKQVPLVLSPEFHMRRLKIISSSAKEFDGRLKHRWSYERRFDLDVRLISELDAGQLISHRFDFRDADKAYQLIDEHPEDVMSVVLTYGDEHA